MRKINRLSGLVAPEVVAVDDFGTPYPPAPLRAPTAPTVAAAVVTAFLCGLAAGVVLTALFCLAGPR